VDHDRRGVLDRPPARTMTAVGRPQKKRRPKPP
jgi:hypothetical protein